MKKLKTSFAYKCRKVRFYMIRALYRRRIDYSISVFCNNCVGSMVLHDYGMRFNSPTINLAIPPSDYIELLSNPKHYFSAPITNISADSEEGYPIGLIDNKIHIRFIHYLSFEEGVKAWRKRVKRINYDNMLAILVKKDGCSEEDVNNFLNIGSTYRKIVIAEEGSMLKGDEIVTITGCLENGLLGDVLEYSSWLGDRYYDQVDWLSFLKKTNKNK